MSEATLELTEREIAIASGQEVEELDSEHDGTLESPIEHGPGTDASAADIAGETASQEETDRDGGPNGLGKDAENASGPDAEQVAEKETRSQDDNPEQTGDWIDDDARQLGKSFGLSEDQLSQFGSLSELRRAGSILDGQSVTTDANPETSGKETKSSEEKETSQSEQDTVTELDLDPENYRKEGYDENTIRLVEYARKTRDEVDAYKNDLESIKSYVRQQEEQRHAELFHDSVDAMDETRFGRSIVDGRVQKLEKGADDNRRKLFEAAETVVDGIVRRAEKAGEDPVIPDLKVLLQRAEMLAFGDEIISGERQRVQREVNEQSKRRRPVSGGGKQAPVQKNQSRPEDTDDVVAELLENQDIKKAWDQFQEESGNQ